MFKVTLLNETTFECDENSTILSAGKSVGVTLEHSCLSARCRSCIVKVLEGDFKQVQDEFVLTEEERQNGYTLSCNAIPITNIRLNVEDLGDVIIPESRTLPCKINSIEKITDEVVKVVLRMPPKAYFKFIAGQYVNIIRGGIKRSYSIANTIKQGNILEFYIKKYNKGLMSDYWFSQAKVNDLLRLEGPLGTFFYRKNNKKDIIFLATGTGIAPIKAILEEMDQNPKIVSNKNIWLFLGARYEQDIFFRPYFKNIKVKFIPVLSRGNEDWKGERGYVQEIVLKQKIDLQNSQVYACGSNDMINSARKVFVEKFLSENQFYSDAFVISN